MVRINVANRNLTVDERASRSLRLPRDRWWRESFLFWSRRMGVNRSGNHEHQSMPSWLWQARRRYHRAPHSWRGTVRLGI